MKHARVFGLVLAALALACAREPQRLPYTPRPTTESQPMRPLPPPEADGRLPSWAKPQRYILDLSIDPRETRYLGRVRIWVQLDKSTDHVVLHAAGPKLLTAAMRRAGVRHVLRHQQRAGPGELGEELVLQFEAALNPGVVELDLEFEAPFSDGLRGLYRVESGGHAYAFSQMEPSDARRAFPCFDEPGFKTPFEVTLTVPSGFLAAANAPVQAQRKQLDSGLTSTVFRVTPPLPTYLVALAVGPLVVSQGRAAKPPIALLSLPGKGALSVLALRTAASQLDLLAEYFGETYPFAKLDLVAVPEMSAGAMENPGLITFREELLLLDEQRASAAAERGLVRIMAHELAHQWFGNLVTPKWWNDLWLNEGLASWMGEKIAQRNRPGLGIADEAAGRRAVAMQLDGLASARSVRQPVRTPNDVLSSFDTITYVKGAAVIGMIEAWLGEVVTQSAIQSYVRTHRHGNASAADLFAALDAASGQKVADVISSLVDQSGVPLLEMDLQCSDNKPVLEVRQREWIPLGRRGGSDKRWLLPICVRARLAKGTERACVLQTEQTQHHALALSGCPTLWTPNDGESGYYRTLLKPKPLQVLARAAPKFLTTVERAGFLSSSFALVQSGSIPLPQHLELLRAFRVERERGVWLEIIRQLHVLDFWMAPDSRADFQSFVRTLLTPAARALSIEPRAGEAESARLSRAELWDALAELGQDPVARRELGRLAVKWLEAPTGVHPDLARVALKNHAGSATNAADGLRRVLLSHLAEASLPERRMVALAGLSGFDDRAQLRAVLDATLTDALRVQDLRNLYPALLERAATAALTVHWMLEHSEAVRRRLPNFALGQVVTALGRVCDPGLVEQLSSVIARNSPDPRAFEKQLSRAVEQAKLCAAARQAHAAKAAEALRR